MKNLITVSKDSPDFKKYLDGSFSKTERALPVKSLNVNTKSEVVTFEIVSLKEISRPSFLAIFLKVLRVRQFIFILFPLFYLLIDLQEKLKDIWVVFWSTVGLIFLYAAVQLRNDYHDHLNGIDRIHPESSSHVLQKGWWTAASVRKLSWSFAFLSFLCSGPVLLVFPQVIWVMALSAALLFWSLFRSQASFKNVPAGEVAFGVLLGPLLCAGYSISITGEFSAKAFGFGCVWGALVLFRLHLQNFVTLAPNSQAGLKNWVGNLGFDRSKIFIRNWWIGTLVAYIFYQSFYLPIYFWCGSVIILLVLSRHFYKSLKNLNSPVGSTVAEVSKQGLLLFNAFVLLWSMERLFFLLVPEAFGALLQGL